MTLLISEHYSTLQGEGIFSGLPCYIIRTAECDLRCSWCDTTHAFTDGKNLEIDEILGDIPEHIQLVLITGGEPLLQKNDINLLIEKLQGPKYNKKIILETGGHLPIEGIHNGVHICMDIKLPGSGESDYDFIKNLPFLKSTDEIKFVVASEDDLDHAETLIHANRLAERFQVLVSPVFGMIDPSRIATWILTSGLNIRLQLQLHKIIWDPSKRGV